MRQRLLWTSGVAVAVVGLSAMVWLWTAYRLPAATSAHSTHIQLAADDADLAVVRLGDADAWTPISRIPPAVVAAVLAAEDRRFMRHIGVDLLAAGHALVGNLREGGIVRGASTITQQLARSLFLTRERSWWRKAREIALALYLERRYTKREILEVYLNTIYLGQDGATPVRGVAEAARHLFAKDLDALTLDEAALLATAIRAPSRALEDTPTRMRARRDQVLHAMAADGWVTAEAVGVALAAPVHVPGPPPTRAPWFVHLARAEAAHRVVPPPGRSTLRVETTLDRSLQSVVETAVRQHLAQAERARALPRGVLQAAVVAMEPSTGHVRALVGGRDYRVSQFDRAVRARRQPGSLFKPFVYLAAFEGARMTAATVVADEPLKVWAGGREWAPDNLDQRFRGPVTVRQALEASLNVPAARVAQEIGPARVSRLARVSGIESPLAAVPSIALGTSEATVLEMATAFAVLANGGYRVRPTTLDEGATGAQLVPGPRPARVVSPESAFIVTHLLRGVMSRGTGGSSWRWGLQHVSAGKTGTSDGLRDAWFVGYTRDLVVAVWVGADDGRPIGLSGSEIALPVWATVMQAAVRRAPPRPFTPPDGIVMVDVDRSTGLRACAGEAAVSEAFRVGSEPAPCEIVATAPPAESMVGLLKVTHQEGQR
jgi:penicillin-binding protein 1B